MALIKLNSRAIPDDTVIASDIADGSISTAKLAADAVTNAKLAADAVTNAKIADSVNRGRRNKIINGGFQVWQRGTSFTTSGVSFAADRFAHYQGSPSANNVTRSTDVPDGFTYSCSLNDAVDMRCSVELPSNGVAGEFYNGSTWTLSFYARSTGADLSYTPAMRFVNGPSYANYGSSWSSSNNSITITSTWQRFEIQFTVDDTPTSNHYAVGFVLGGTAGRIIRFTGIQLEAGDTATPFEHRSYGEELALCQRYYQRTQRSASGYQNLVVSTCYSTGTDTRGIIPFVTEMRVAPSVSTSGNLMVLGAGGSLSSINAGDGTTTHMAGIRVNTTSNLSTGQSTLLRGNNDATAHIQFDAEM